MRRTALFALIIALFVLIPSATLLAQSDPYEWNFSETVSFAPMSLNFSYPAGWTVDTPFDNILVLAENEADLALINDNDPTTTTAGHWFQIIGAPLELIGLDASATAAQVMQMAREGLALQPAETFESPQFFNHPAALSAHTDSINPNYFILSWVDSDQFGIIIGQAPASANSLAWVYGWTEFLKALLANNGTSGAVSAVNAGADQPQQDNSLDISNEDATPLRIEAPVVGDLSSDKPMMVYTFNASESTRMGFYANVIDGDMSLNLAVVAQDGETVLAAATGSANNGVVADVEETGTYFLVVQGTNGSSAHYRLMIDADPALPINPFVVTTFPAMGESSKCSEVEPGGWLDANDYLNVCYALMLLEDNTTVAIQWWSPSGEIWGEEENVLNADYNGALVLT
ncbi:MAG: hypothetical protein JNJ61_15355, partial [Anaerolineae bacterium]|nr:hypothetical protein [Anaerolineae bacterium]